MASIWRAILRLYFPYPTFTTSVVVFFKGKEEGNSGFEEFSPSRTSEIPDCIHGHENDEDAIENQRPDVILSTTKIIIPHEEHTSEGVHTEHNTDSQSLQKDATEETATAWSQCWPARHGFSNTSPVGFVRFLAEFLAWFRLHWFHFYTDSRRGV